MDNRFKLAYGKYVKFITSINGWETTLCPYGYDTFVRMCMYKEDFKKRWVGDELIVKGLRYPHIFNVMDIPEEKIYLRLRRV